MKLVFPNGEHGQVLLNPGVNRIGSSAEAAIVLTMPGILPEHCAIHVTQNGANLQVPSGAGPVEGGGGTVKPCAGVAGTWTPDPGVCCTAAGPTANSWAMAWNEGR